MEVGHPLPLGTLTSPPLRQRRRRTQLGRARPPHGRVELLAKQRQPGVLHSRLRSTSPRRRLPLRHGSRTQWRPGVYRLPCRSGSGPPPHVAPATEVAAALPSVPLGGLEAAAMEVDPEPSSAHGGIVTPPANPGSPEYSVGAPAQWLSQRRGSGLHTSDHPASLPTGRPRPSCCFRSSGPGLGPGRHASCCPKSHQPRRSLLRREVVPPLPA